MEASPPEKESDETGVPWVTLLLVGAAVLGAIIGIRAALVDNNGGDNLDRSVRQDVKRGAAVVESIRFVYAEEAAAAVQVAEARIRARDLRRAAQGKPGPVADYLRSEAAAQDQLVKSLEPTHPITSNPKYRKPDGSYDVPLRLADERAERPDLLHVDPDATEQVGLDSAQSATLLRAATIPLAVAFMFGALTEGFPSRRRPFLVVGYAFLAFGALFAIVVELAT
jgi:hypothetical protein